ncbi:MAG: rhodanese-like domain-containing protein [Pseudomonadota bacterium]
MQTISAQALSSLQKNGTVHLIDVRTPAEFGAVHAKGAVNIPLDKLEPSALAHCNDDPVFLICKSGVRARKAMDKLSQAGFTKTFEVEGGTDAWVNAKLPVQKGRKALGLEQQVRIIVGSMALTGAALVLAGQPLGLILVAMMGMGLVYAGITDTCGLAMLIAKAPWNQNVKACPAGSAASAA